MNLFLFYTFATLENFVSFVESQTSCGGGGTVFQPGGSVSQRLTASHKNGKSSNFLKMVPQTPLCSFSSHLLKVAASPQALRVAAAVTFYHAFTACAQHQCSLEKRESCDLPCNMTAAYDIPHDAPLEIFPNILAYLFLKVVLNWCDIAAFS